MWRAQTLVFLSLPNHPASGAAFTREGRGLVSICLGLWGWFLIFFFSNLRSCARTLALCCVFICVCKTHAEDTPKLLQRHYRVTAPMDQKTDSCLHLSCSICKIWGGWGGAGRVLQNKIIGTLCRYCLSLT